MAGAIAASDPVSVGSTAKKAGAEKVVLEFKHKATSTVLPSLATVVDSAKEIAPTLPLEAAVIQSEAPVVTPSLPEPSELEYTAHTVSSVVTPAPEQAVVPADSMQCSLSRRAEDAEGAGKWLLTCHDIVPLLKTISFLEDSECKVLDGIRECTTTVS
jgi:hypothetical protein